jgi:hypothetical protein
MSRSMNRIRIPEIASVVALSQPPGNCSACVANCRRTVILPPAAVVEASLEAPSQRGMRVGARDLKERLGCFGVSAFRAHLAAGIEVERAPL